MWCALQGCIGQKFVNEDRWLKYIEDKDIDYQFIEVGPHNIKEVLLDSYATFESRCLNKPEKQFLTHLIGTDDYQYKLGVGDECHQKSQLYLEIQTVKQDETLSTFFPGKREVAGPRVSYRRCSRIFILALCWTIFCCWNDNL